MKPQRKDAGERKIEEHPNHPQPKPSPVQSAVGSACTSRIRLTATNDYAGNDHQPSPKSSSATNRPPSSSVPGIAKVVSIERCYNYNSDPLFIVLVSLY